MEMALRDTVRGLHCVWRMTNLVGQLLVLVPAYIRETSSSVVSRGETSTQASTKWPKHIDKDGASVFRLAANSQSLHTLVRDDPLTGQGVVLKTRAIHQQLKLE